MTNLWQALLNFNTMRSGTFYHLLKHVKQRPTWTRPNTKMMGSTGAGTARNRGADLLSVRGGAPIVGKWAGEMPTITMASFLMGNFEWSEVQPPQTQNGVRRAVTFNNNTLQHFYTPFDGNLSIDLKLRIPPSVLPVVEVREGNNVTMTCAAHGNPKPTIVWRLTDRRIIRYNETDGYGEPPIKYVFLTPLPSTMEIYRTKQGVLTCKLNSARAPLVWHRDGKPIDVDDPRYQIEKDAAGRFTLTIRVVEQIDQGLWTAFVNKAVTSKCQVYVEEPRDTFVVPLKSQRANEKENATFECDVNDKDIDVEWFHDGAKIKMDGRHFKEERAGRRRRLLITDVRIEDHGEYKCTTKDDKTMAQLIVDPLNKFIKKLEDQQVYEKDDVNLHCETKDTRTPAQWFRNGKPISSMPGSKFECQSRSGVHTMKISKIEMNEGDKYEIDVAGLRGSCRITVLEAERKPVIKWKPQKFECEAGKEKRIKVPFEVKGTRRGDPKPILLRNGKPVDLDKMKDLVEVVINGDVAEIVFKNPQKSEAGKWSLQLENTGGVSAAAPFELVVKGKPKTPKGPLDTLDVTADSCKLKWKPADADELSPTRGFIVEMQEGPGGPWKKIGETKIAEFQVNNLKEHEQYKFRIKAFNEIGESEPLTGETILAKNPYTVPGKPRHMEASDINADTLTLQWSPPESDGGAPIEQYIVERRDKSDKDWATVGTVPATGSGKHQIVDDKVVEGKEYYYRVRAVNKAGPGDPCDHGKPFKIQAKPAPPAFTAGGIQDQRLRVGETIKYEVGISGEPLPAVTWEVNEKPLKTLAWKPPADDGGEPLTGYVVEAQDVDGGGKFVPVGQVGPGETSLQLTAKWVVKFGGKPAPEVSWSKNQQPITDLSGSIQVDTKKNDHTILCIPAAVRADRGAYALLVKNSSGSDTVTADLTVLDIKNGDKMGCHWTSGHTWRKALFLSVTLGALLDIVLIAFDYLQPADESLYI